MILNCIVFPDFAFVSTIFPNNINSMIFPLPQQYFHCFHFSKIFLLYHQYFRPFYFSKIFPLYQNCSILFIIKKNIVSSFPTVYYSKKISFVSTISQNNVIFPDFPFAICLNSIYYNYVHNIPGFSFLCQYHFTTIWYSFF